MNVRLTLICALVVACTGTTIYGQTQSTSSANPYYSSMKKKLTFYTNFTSKVSKIEFSGISGTPALKYQPNENINMGFGLSYRWLSISTSFNFKPLNRDDTLYGKTKCFGIDVDIYGKTMIWMFNIQTYDGYYWANPNKYDGFRDWNIKDSVPLRPDIKTGHYNIKAIYAFNHQKYSAKAAFTNSERQTKSAGSMLIGGYSTAFYMGADSATPVPPELRDRFPKSGTLAALISLNQGTSLGYAYTVVIKKSFYISAAWMLGFAPQYAIYFDVSNSKVEDDLTLSLKSHARFAIGFDKETFYIGFSAIADNVLMKKGVNCGYTRLRFIYGKRFDVGKRR